MAKFNEILVGRFNRGLQKLLSMKGPASVPQLSSELQPVIQMFHGSEDRYLESWDRFGQFILQAGGAAQNAAVRFRNPKSSNIIAVLEKILYTDSSAAADSIQVSLSNQTADFTTVPALAGTTLDIRGRNAPTSILSSQINLAALVGSQILAALVAPNVSWDFIVDGIQELPVLPGMSYDFRNNVVNQAITLSFIWRERFLEDSERA